jgi:hypothetical protein
MSVRHMQSNTKLHFYRVDSILTSHLVIPGYENHPGEWPICLKVSNIPYGSVSCTSNAKENKVLYRFFSHVSMLSKVIYLIVPYEHYNF